MIGGRNLYALFSVGTSTALTDVELLERFLERRDRANRASSAAEAAFEAIVRRHGPMVLGVCRRYLDDPNDVEDAFQATFVVLFRRAGAIRIGESLGPWLHGVSRRVAAKARAMALRRRAREAGRCVEPATDPDAEDRRREAAEALDEELDRLPSRYRVPIILCHLEGLTYQEAARRLDCPVGTIGVRLSRGRELLRTRLARRGAILPAGLGTVAPTPEAGTVVLPPALVDATVQVAVRGAGGRAVTTGLASSSVFSLSEGLLRTMFMTKVKTAALTLISAGVILAGAGVLLRQAIATPGGRQAVPSRPVAARGAETPDENRSPRADDPTRRARELIYVFRTYRMGCRDEEWARTIRELAAIGKDAVPELVAELDRTDRDPTIRSLVFTLRAIGDPRAVPALIRAIPKALRPHGSDYGLGIADPDLRAFMRAHQDYKADQSQVVACGRPVNEVLTALERITGHSEPCDDAGNDIRHIFLGGTADEQARRRASFAQWHDRWERWWSEHWQQVATREQLQAVGRSQPDRDLVEMAGVARYGPLFPTGPEVRLGPVRMLRLAPSEYWDARSHLDLDTGRAFRQYEGLKATDGGAAADFGSRVTAWYRRNGIDVLCRGLVDGIDLQLWLIDDRRWETIEAEVRKDGPLPLGEEVRHTSAPGDGSKDELKTFLFTTREGGRGILQVFPKDPDADRYRLRYRMWSTARSNPTAQPPAANPAGAASPGQPFGRIVTTTLDEPAAGRDSLLDLETGRKAAPPEFVKPQEFANARSLTRNGRFTEWCRDHGLDVFRRAAVTKVEAKAAPAGGAPAAPQAVRTRFGLTGLGMIAARVEPQAFDELTVGEAREILERIPEQQSVAGWISLNTHPTERPDTFAFRTREGSLGLLQMEVIGNDSRKLTIRYRLGRRD